MTTVTIPLKECIFNGGWTLTGGSDEVEIVEDDDDGSFLLAPNIDWNQHADLWFTLDSWTPPTPEEWYNFRAARLVYRMDTGGGGSGPLTRMKMQVGSASGSGIAFYISDSIYGPATMRSPWSRRVITGNEVIVVSYKPTAQAQQRPRLYNLELELEYNKIPDVSVLYPSGTIDDQARPAIQATYADEDNDPMNGYKLWIYEEAVYDDPSFEAGETEGYTWYSGLKVVNGDLPEYLYPGTNLESGTTYKAYFQARSALGDWSLIANSEPFTPNYVAIDGPDVTQTIEDYHTKFDVISGVNLLTWRQSSGEGPSVAYEAFTSGVTVDVSEDQADRGTQSIKATITSNGTRSIVTDPLPVKEDVTVQLSGRAYVDAAASRDINMSLVWCDKYGNAIGTADDTPATTISTGAWDDIDGFSGDGVVVPTGIKYVKLVLRMASMVSGEDVYFDQLALTPNSDVITTPTRGGLVVKQAYYVLERSFDTGTTWEMADGPLAIDNAEQVGTLYDLSPPLGATTSYRVRMLLTEDESEGGWDTEYSTTTTAAIGTPAGACWVVRDCQDASRDALTVDVSKPYPWRWASDEQMAKFAALGRKYPLVVADVRTRARRIDNLRLEFTVKAEFDEFFAIREDQHIFCLSRVQTDEQFYMRIAGDIYVEESNTDPVIYGIQFNVVEVENPQGND